MSYSRMLAHNFLILLLQNISGANFKCNEFNDYLLFICFLKLFVLQDMPKYYNQRFRLFSKLNEGILMDRGELLFFNSYSRIS